MPIDKQIVAIPFSKGLDQKTDSKQVALGSQLDLKNLIFTKLMKLIPRNGYENLSRNVYSSGSPADITNASNLLAYDEGLVLKDNGYFYGYVSEKSKWAPTLSTYTENASLDVQPVVSLNLTQAAYSALGNALPKPGVVAARAASGVEAYVYSSDVTKLTIVLYSPSGDIIAVPTTKTSVQIVNYSIQVVGSTFYVFVNESTGPSAYALNLYIFTDSPVAAWPSPTVMDATPTTEIDAMDSTVLGTDCYIAACNKVYKYTTSGGVTTSVATSVTPVTVSIVADGTTLYFGYGTTALVGVKTYSTSLVLGTTTTQSLSTSGYLQITIAVSSGVGIMFIASIGRPINSWTFLGAAATLHPILFAGSTGYLISKPRFNAGRVYTAFGSSSKAQQCGYLCSFALTSAAATVLSDATVVTKFGYGSIYIYPYTLSGGSGGEPLTPLPHLLKTGAEFTVPYYTSNFIPNYTVSSVQSSVFSLTRATTSIGPKPQSFSYGGLANLLGGNVSSYDGEFAFELGFPEFPTCNVSETGDMVNSLAEGTYAYKLVFAYVDNKGQTQRSAPSLFQSVVIDAADKVALITMTTPFWSNKKNIIVEAYRTVSTGTVYFLSNTFVIAQGDSVWGQASLSFRDFTPDSDIIKNRQLYTNGGEVENIVPPTSRVGTSYKNRIMLVPSETPSSYWYSKQIIPTVPPEFSDFFVMNVDARGGAITAMAQMDDKLIILKKNLVYYSAGDGPSANGLNNDFLPPQLLASDTGCVDRDSVVLTPVGLMFKSPKGIYILSRGLELQYIGAPVEDYNDLTITSAQLLETRNQVRFTTSSSVELLYDYYAKQWDVLEPISGVDSCTLEDLYYFVSSDGIVHKETPGAYLDNGAQITTVVDTGWLSFAQVQGFERLRQFLLLGNALSAHTLTVEVSYDFSETPTQTTVITQSSALDPYQIRAFFTRQKCEAMRIKLTCVPSGTGGGLEFSNINLEVGVKTGSNKIRASKSYGR